MSNTTNLNLERPDRGATGWHTSLNSNMTKLDTGYGNNVATVADLPQVYIETGTFNSTTGDTITLPVEVDATNEYSVEITPTSRAGVIGDIWVTKTTSNFVVKCVEANTTDTFEATIYYIGDIASYGGSIYRRWYVSPDAAITDHGDTADTGSLAWVLDQIGATAATVELPGNKAYVISTTLVIADNIKLIPQMGAIFTDDGSNADLTIEAIIDAGRYQIFDWGNGSGDITFGEKSTDKLYPEWWGAIGDRSTDSTAAIQSALDASSISAPESNRIPVSFGVGDYLSAELSHDGQTLMIGQEAGVSRLYYNGAGGNDSYLIGYDVNSPTGYMPWGGYKNLSLHGYISGGEIAEHIWKNINTAGIDFFAKFDNCHFLECFGNAIHQESTSAGIVNWHLNRVRFDSIGGWCISLATPADQENRPLHISEFTIDNNISGDFATQAALDGYYNTTHWGKGFVYLDTGNGGINLSIEEGRIELNKRLIIEGTYRPCMVLSEVASGYNTVLLKNVVGYFSYADAGIFLYSPDDRTHFSYYNSYFQNASALFENSSGNNMQGYSYGTGSYTDVASGVYGQNYGIRLQDRQIEFQDKTANTFNLYKSGDIIFNTDPTLGANVGWIMTSPEDGIAASNYPNQALSTTAICTAASALVTLSSATELYKFSVGLGIVLKGAGVAAADLETSVVSIDEENSRFTVDDAASTSVNPLTINTMGATLTKFGIIDLQGSVAWDPGSIADGDEEAKEVTVTGAALGDFAIASFSLDVADLVLNAQVTAADTVTCILANNTSGAVDLGSGTVYVKVIKK